MNEISTIIPTLDEELHIHRAVRSARALGPVWVVDCGSSDRTVQIASSAGARIVEQPWLGHARQKNWCLDHLPLSTPWVMFLDADEYLPDDLQCALREATSDPRVRAWYVPRRNVFMGRDLRHAWWYPDYQLRLFVMGEARYEDREVHEHMSTRAVTGYLKTPLIHENLKGIDAFLERHVRYARAEAAEILGARARPTFTVRNLLDRSQRRRLLKARVWHRMPFRPLVRFSWLFLIRRGFLDGCQGLIYCQLLAAYESMVDAYVLERRLDLQPRDQS